MKIDRRNFLQGTIGLLASLKSSAWAKSHPLENASEEISQSKANNNSKPVNKFLSMETPDIPKLPYELKDGVKVFNLIAEPVKREFIPGKIFDVWGYNGSMPGPTIEVMEGDRVRIIFHNKLPEPTTIHWHGLEVPIEMDGVPAISQPLVYPGETFIYEFTLHQHGTFFYHSHMAMQEMIGMVGFFIIYPKKPYQPRADMDFGLVLQEWAILPNNTIPNTLSMEFNWLTINGKAGPATTPLIVKLGDRVRIRFLNLSMNHHPMHLHGHQFYVTGTEGGRIPESKWYPENTVLVGVAQVRVIEFDAKYLGDWMLHCHLPHHMMNQMISMVGPIAHLGSGMNTGMGMEEGMGIISRGHALSKEFGPGFGRGMGMATREKPISNLAGVRNSGGHNHHEPLAKKRFPGFPQDMWMPIDELVAKPQTYGLADGWSGSVMGMMTLVRILPPDMYDKIMKMIEEDKIKQEQEVIPHHH